MFGYTIASAPGLPAPCWDPQLDAALKAAAQRAVDALATIAEKGGSLERLQAAQVLLHAAMHYGPPGELTGGYADFGTPDEAGYDDDPPSIYTEEGV